MANGKTTYIERLETAIWQLNHAASDANDAILDLYRYLQSTKFHEDTTVQVADIFARLEPVRKALANTEGDIVYRVTQKVDAEVR